MLYGTGLDADALECGRTLPRADRWTLERDRLHASLASLRTLPACFQLPARALRGNLRLIR
jgi:hypothetical protein